MGYDHISMDLVKDCVHLICRAITHIVNLSLTSGIVPDQLKIACLIHYNYRAVSVLPALSKILERVIYNHLLDYFNKHEILPST